MRKKDIYGSYVKSSKAIYRSEMKEMMGQLVGYSALIHFLCGNKNLFVEYESEPYCLAADGYKWLMILPMDEYWCITAMYNQENEIIEWYFDISKNNFIDERGMPCIDDLFLDLVLLPDGRIIMLDEDELQEALDSGQIIKDDYNFAHKTYNQLSQSKWMDVNFTRSFCDAILLQYFK